MQRTFASKRIAQHSALTLGIIATTNFQGHGTRRGTSAYTSMRNAGYSSQFYVHICKSTCRIRW
jgi:hypothetical protein